MYFASDNAAPAHPKVMEALMHANEGYAPSYGADALMDRLRDQIRDVFEAPEAAVYLVATGSTANALALASYCPPWSAIYCHEESHIEQDECGAPEFYTSGAKLTLLPGADAKIDPNALTDVLAVAATKGVHNVQRGALSLTNVTELGAVYTPSEVATLADCAKRHDIPVHMDGARFANALVATNASPAEMTWRAGIDALSFGGTKNGLLGVEAVIFFNPEKAWEFELRRKRGGHLFSKHRYLSAQMVAYLEGDLWLDLARAANAAGKRLANGLAAHPDAELMHPAQANMIFMRLPRALHQKAFEAGAVYYPAPDGQSFEGPEAEPSGARLVTSWCTTADDVDAYLAAISR